MRAVYAQVARRETRGQREDVTLTEADRLAVREHGGDRLAIATTIPQSRHTWVLSTRYTDRRDTSGFERQFDKHNMGEWRNGRRGGLMPQASRIECPGGNAGSRAPQIRGRLHRLGGMLAPSQALGTLREGVETRRGAPATGNAVGEEMVQTTNSQMMAGGESRSGRKNRWPKGREGSTPSSPTMCYQATHPSDVRAASYSRVDSPLVGSTRCHAPGLTGDTHPISWRKPFAPRARCAKSSRHIDRGFRMQRWPHNFVLIAVRSVRFYALGSG